ncbi:GvpL/GvpF family gas vesicle protein [Amycolatopsis sp. FDAARGOS 1241]|uniref:GvpL/GvpF family gas vesicle protein n=1 Tax=Amycolatopsis sp. FDAARGOS 1241 TaxID=2778070 RepID=UPI001950F4B5|nr:GvpL/GvpF family gas vesicle protein [Amycolatopsis sp. FDAARGOS 1241]QRP49679.1 GvpL/GvpF family gas vesicle protein [Amycolatopsis sp. FDAARGOS 1241]
MTATDGTAVWLYAVTRSAEFAGLDMLPGVAAEPPRVIEAGGLAAFVGDVPLTSFGEEALRRNLEDLDWLAAVARAHDAVIANLVDRAPVVPIRLATVYHDDESVRAVLEQRAEDFERTLRHVSGRIEWGVKAFLDTEPEPAPAASPGKGAGVAYLARRRSALAAREERQQRAAEEVHRLHAALSELAVDACTHPPQSRALAGEDGPMVLNGAYLVDTGQSGRFAEAVDSCGRESGVLSVRLTGPWPPYSFSSLEAP